MYNYWNLNNTPKSESTQKWANYSNLSRCTATSIPADNVAVNVCTSVFRGACGGKQKLALLWENPIQDARLYTKRGQFRHLTWFREKILHFFCFPLLFWTFIKTTYIIHLLPTVWLSPWEAANAQEALLYWQILYTTWRCAFIVQYKILSVWM